MLGLHDIDAREEPGANARQDDGGAHNARRTKASHRIHRRPYQGMSHCAFFQRTGSHSFLFSSIHQVWNLASDKHTDPDVSIPATGAVEHLEVSGSSILFSVDEPVSPDTPDNTVGMVYLLNTADMSSLAIKVCDFVTFILHSPRAFSQHALNLSNDADFL
jgi:hypothetical protein